MGLSISFTPQVHQQVIDRITKGVEAYGFVCRGVTESPLKGDKGGNTGESLHMHTHSRISNAGRV